MGKQRLDYIDIAKGIGILCVIWGHIVTNNFSGSFIYAFHMPLFFFLSGMFFNGAKYTSFFDFIKKRGRRLLVPYVIYSVVTWAIWAVFNRLTGNNTVNIWQSLLETVYARGSGQFLHHNSALWFIPCLFAVEIMYYFVSKLKRWLIIPVCLLISGVSMTLEHFFGEEYLFLLPWNLDAAMMALPFYAVGNVFSWKPELHNRLLDYTRNHIIISIAAVMILFAVVGVLTKFFGTVSMGHSYYGNEYIFHIRALMGSFAVCWLSVLVSQAKYIGKLKQGLKWFGENSLDVMCTHIPVKGVLIVAVAILLHTSNQMVTDNVLYALMVFVLTVAIEVVLIWAINRIKLYFKK